MRLREYLEIKDGLKSKLAEAVDYEDEDEYEDDDYSYIEDGDLAWQEAADVLASYDTISIKDELKTRRFLNYLTSLNIKLTDTITVDDFISLLLDYLNEGLEQSTGIGYTFCTGSHLYLCYEYGVMHLNMRDEFSLDYFPFYEFKEDLARDIYYDFPNKPAYRTYQGAPLEDTVDNLINRIVDIYGAEVDF